MIGATLYFLYAIVQAILTARYALELKKDDDSGPTGMVVVMILVAPIVSACLIGYGFWYSITWLVTYRSKPNEEVKQDASVEK
jgi:phosphate/sulfate permease